MKRLFKWLSVPLWAIIGLFAGALTYIPFLLIGLAVSLVLQRLPEIAQFIVNILATIGFAISGFVSGMFSVKLGTDRMPEYRKGISVAIFIFILLGVVLWLISFIMVGDALIRDYVNRIALLAGGFIAMLMSYNEGDEFKEKQPKYKKKENNIYNPYLHLHQVEYNTGDVLLVKADNGEEVEVMVLPQAGIGSDKIVISSVDLEDTHTFKGKRVNEFTQKELNNILVKRLN